MTEMTDPYQWQGRTMFGADGEKIGKITEIYEDPATGRPEWATVSTGLFGTKSNFVPLDGAVPADDVIRARFTKDQVKDAPGVDHDDELSAQEERRLFDHYGVPYETSSSGSRDDVDRGRRDDGRSDTMRSDAGARGAGDDAPRSADGGRESSTTGGARLRRYVVTERVIVSGSDGGADTDTRDAAGTRSTGRDAEDRQGRTTRH